MKALDKAAVARVYRQYAPVYDLVFGRVLEPGRVEMNRIVTKFAPQRLLEVGVGTGLALPNYPADAWTVGVDLSQHMLQRGLNLVARESLNVHLLCADAEQLPFVDSSFDCITLPYVLSVTPHPERLLAELRRVCTPGGHIVVLSHFRGAGVWRLLERLIAPFADRIGFHSTLTIDVLDNSGWDVKNTRHVNLFGLSRLIVLQNKVG